MATRTLSDEIVILNDSVATQPVKIFELIVVMEKIFLITNKMTLKCTFILIVSHSICNYEEIL
jgi:hypothetical protein